MTHAAVDHLAAAFLEKCAEIRSVAPQRILVDNLRDARTKVRGGVAFAWKH